MTLKNNLPKFIAEEKYIKEILDAIQPEIDKLKIKVAEAFLESCVSTSTSRGVKRFERDYAIQYDATLSLDERKAVIINKMLSKKRLNKEGLYNLIKQIVGKTQFYISNKSKKYHFKIMLVGEDAKNKLYKALYNSRPAHLTFEIVSETYQRRCGTFMCGRNHFVERSRNV